MSLTPRLGKKRGYTKVSAGAVDLTCPYRNAKVKTAPIGSDVGSRKRAGGAGPLSINSLTDSNRKYSG